MEITVHDTLADDDARYWALYERAFAHLRTHAVQRHLMHREEFTDLIGDARIAKYVVHDAARDRLAGMAAMTNQLDAVPLVSPEYFAHHYPEAVSRANLYYVNFVAVDPDYQGTGTMGLIIGEMCRRVAPLGGVICLDVPEHNDVVHRLPVAIERIANTFTPATAKRRLDSQVYYAYQFPTPA